MKNNMEENKLLQLLEDYFEISKFPRCEKVIKQSLESYREEVRKDEREKILGKDMKFDGSEHIKHHTEDRCVDWCPKCKLKQLNK